VTRYYVTVVVVVEADCADTAVNAVAIAVLNHDVDTPGCAAHLVGLDVEGEPVMEVFVEDGPDDVKLVDGEAWTLRDVDGGAVPS
jgi:hypothetical protein